MILVKGDKVRFKNGIVTVTDVDFKLKVAHMMFYPSADAFDNEVPFVAPLSLEILRLYCLDPYWVHPLNYTYGYEKFQVTSDDKVIYEDSMFRLVTPSSFCTDGTIYIIKDKTHYPVLDSDLFSIKSYTGSTIRVVYNKVFSKDMLEEYINSLMAKPMKATAITGKVVEIVRDGRTYQGIDTKYSPYYNEFVICVKTNSALLYLPLKVLNLILNPTTDV